MQANTRTKARPGHIPTSTACWDALQAAHKQGTATHHLLCFGTCAALKERPEGDVPIRLVPVGELPSRPELAAPMLAAPLAAAPGAMAGGRHGGRLGVGALGRWLAEGEVP